MAAYHIADEPAPGPLSRFAVNPIFPLLGLMLGGAWLAWPWFAFNSWAVGSPTRRKEAVWLVAGLIALVASSALVFRLSEAEIVPRAAVPYLVLAIVVVKLAVAYVVYALQSQTVEIYQYFGGKLQNGVWVAAASYFVGDRLLADVPVVLWLVLN